MHPSALRLLQAALPEGTDAALISSSVNRRYYTNMASSDGMLLVTRDWAGLLVDFRYIELARQTVSSCEVILRERAYVQLREQLAAHNIKALAIEAERTTIAQLSRLQKELPDILLQTDAALDAQINRQRAIKSPWELEQMIASQDIVDRSFTELLNLLRPGMTERQVAVGLSHRMRLFGSEADAFDIIAVSGANSSMPHGVPTDKPIAAGEFLTLDFGAIYHGYCSDMTRTIAIGHATDEMHAVYHKVREAQEAAFSQIRAGVPCKEIDQAARDCIDRDYPDCFGHSLGHSLGLEIHETPNFSSSSDAVLQSGNVLSVEPGIYLAGHFGVRIEDVIVATKTGFQNLTTSPKELIIL